MLAASSAKLELTQEISMYKTVHKATNHKKQMNNNKIRLCAAAAAAAIDC
jgi:hypothetical protein